MELPSNSFKILSINSNHGDKYELRAEDNSLSFSFDYIIEVSSSREEQLLGFHTAEDSMICVERRLINESSDKIEKLKLY